MVLRGCFTEPIRCGETIGFSTKATFIKEAKAYLSSSIALIREWTPRRHCGRVLAALVSGHPTLEGVRFWNGFLRK